MNQRFNVIRRFALHQNMVSLQKYNLYDLYEIC